MSKVDPSRKSSLLNLTPADSLSKSSLRRQKRKQKEALAGNTAGLQDLAEAMDEVAQDLEESSSEEQQLIDEDDDMDAITAASRKEVTAYPTVGAQKGKKDATVTEKARKKALSLEMQRQGLILADPAYTKNPFAALRLHAQNTLAFDKGAVKSKH